MKPIKGNPIIGILTSKGKKIPIIGNLKLFRRISVELANKGGLAIIITPESIIDNRIRYGYIYNTESHGWMKINDPPLPTQIYNRIPSRKSEQTESYQRFVSWCETCSIKLFNPCFFTKWDLYNSLVREPKLRPYLPYTETLYSLGQLQALLHRFSSLYIKPNEGSKGNGIFVLSQSNNEITLKDLKEEHRFSSVRQLWKSTIEKYLSRQAYIVQEKIPLITYNDRPFDFRVWAHKVNSEWTLSGIGIRQSKQDGVTTHVLKGGNRLNFDDVATTADAKILTKLMTLSGQQLERDYGEVKEFSMDIGKTNDGAFYIFEVNAKPMEFDEPEISRKGLQHLIQIFIEQK